MPSVAQFDAVAREVVADDDPFTFTLAGEEFVVVEVITAMDVIRAERAPDIGAALDLLARVVRQGDGEQERLEAAVDACNLTMPQLTGLVGDIIRAQAARPTKKPSGSAAGRSSTSTSSSERATKLESLGLVEVEEPTGSAV